VTGGHVRQIFVDTLKNDGLGMNARRTGGRIHYDYPIAVLVAEKR
jgi:hypothetical protein